MRIKQKWIASLLAFAIGTSSMAVPISEVMPVFAAAEDLKPTITNEDIKALTPNKIVTGKPSFFSRLILMISIHAPCVRGRLRNCAMIT